VATYTDTFNRTDAGTLGTASGGWSWTEWNNNHTIVSNTAVPENDSACGSFTPEHDSGDHSATVTVTTLPQASSFIGPVVRAPATIGTNNANTGELIVGMVSGASIDTWTIRTKGNNSSTLTTQATGGATSALAPGDVILVEASGTTVTVYQNGVQRVQWTSATLTTQKRAGIFCDMPGGASTYPAWDSFTAQDLVTTTTGVLAGTTPAPTGAIAATLADEGALAGTTQAPSGTLTAALSIAAELAGTTPAPSGDLFTTPPLEGAFAGTIPAPTGTLTAALSLVAALAGTTPAPSGTLTDVVASTVDYPIRAGTVTDHRTGRAPGTVLDHVARYRVPTLDPRDLYPPDYAEAY
jgi:hypothetical protein